MVGDGRACNRGHLHHLAGGVPSDQAPDGTRHSSGRQRGRLSAHRAYPGRPDHPGNPSGITGR